VTVPVGRGGNLDTDVTRWTENSNEDKLYMFILRVYTTSRTSDVNTLKHMCLGLFSTSFFCSLIHSFIHSIFFFFILATDSSTLELRDHDACVFRTYCCLFFARALFIYLSLFSFFCYLVAGDLDYSADAL